MRCNDRRNVSASQNEFELRELVNEWRGRDVNVTYPPLQDLISPRKTHSSY
jgi:hypothetical protein